MIPYQKLKIINFFLFVLTLLLTKPLFAEKIAIVDTISGIKLRKSPSAKAELIMSIPNGAYVKILKTDGPKASFEGKEGNWLGISYFDPFQSISVSGWCFSGFLFRHDGNRHLVARENYILKKYKNIKIRKQKFKNKSGCPLIQVKLKNGSYHEITEPKYRGTSDVEYLLYDYAPKPGFYVFYVSFYGESGNYIIINDKTGQKSKIEGETGLIFSPDGKYLVTTYGIYDDKGFRIYKTGPSGIKQILNNNFLPKHNLEPIKVSFYNNSTLLLYLKEYSHTYSGFFSIRYDINSRKFYAGTGKYTFGLNDAVKLKKAVGILTGHLKFKNPRPDQSYGYKWGLPGIEYEINEANEDKEAKSKILNQLIHLKNARLNPELLLSTYDFLYEKLNRKDNQYYYDYYRNFLKVYARLYLAMLKKPGRNTILKEFDNYRKKPKKREGNKSPDFRYFYKDLMLKHGIDLTANVPYMRLNSETIGFWIRRMKDGTDKTIFQIMEHIFQNHDSAFYNKYIKGKGIEEEALKALPEAIYWKDGEYNYYKTPKETLQKKGTRVKILKREIRKSQLKYFVNLNGKNQWVSDYYLFHDYP